jgi:hypothetical protein
MAFSQAIPAASFHFVNQIAERTFIVLQILTAVATFQGRESFLALRLIV